MLRSRRSMCQNLAVNEFVAPGVAKVMLVLGDELVRGPCFLKPQSNRHTPVLPTRMR